MIVGLLGFIGSGKGTAGDILKDMGFAPVSFAKSVKDITAEMFGWPRHLLEGDTQVSRDWREASCEFWSKELGKDFTPRYALQLMGTEVGRDVFHKDFWVIKAKNEMHKQLSKGVENFVITDVRFPNEIKMIQQEGGILIEVQRGIKPHWYDIAIKANRDDNHALSWMTERSGIHVSEWAWIGSDIDYVIENNGTKEELKKNLARCLTNSFGMNIIRESIEGVL